MINLFPKYTPPGKPLPVQQGVALSDGTLVMAQPQGRAGGPMRNVGNSRKLRRAADRQGR